MNEIMLAFWKNMAEIVNLKARELFLQELIKLFQQELKELHKRNREEE